MNKTCRLPMPLYSLSNVIYLMIYTAVEILNNQEMIYLEKNGISYMKLILHFT